MNPEPTHPHPETGFLRRALSRDQRCRRSSAPYSGAWQGAAWGALAALGAILLSTAHGLFGPAGPARLLTGALFICATFALAGLILALLWRLLRAVPLFYVWVIGSAVPALALMALTGISQAAGILVTGLGVLALASLLGASLVLARGQGLQERPRWQRRLVVGGLTFSLLGLAGGLPWLLAPGSPVPPPPNAAARSADGVQQLDLPDPALPGPYSVRRLYYGSGTDRHRPEYGPEADVITSGVDGSPLARGWSGLRTAYWGFGPEALPLNARVWYPQGDGPFPLVLIVHGQHPMEEFSDPGYAYLGELLAGRGFITVSVDQNFVNLSPLADLLILQGLKDENVLRAWLLLEHLRAWRGWNEDPRSPFYHMVDLKNIALVGHSRGGEAVAIATAFNRLPAHPDDARLSFDFGFNIRSVIAIAPVEGSYKPAGQDVTLEGVNYLLLHGAHDMDVFTFQGDRQYARVRFSGDGDGFKAALYIYGANHGQFNTVWGRKDLFEPVMRVFNLGQIMPAEDQQRAAAVTISAFLEATLRGQAAYRAWFQDLRRGPGWLPDTIYLHQYQDAATRIVSAFEEDIDPSTTTLPGGALTGSGLTLWHEKPLRAKWNTTGSQAVYLGWDAQANSPAAVYTIHIPPGALELDASSILVFSLADGSQDPPARPAPIDLTIEVADDDGETARLPLSHFALLQPQLAAHLGKARFFASFPASEVVLQHFEFRLGDFARENPAFRPQALAAVRLVFDRTPAGVVVLDDLGFRLER